MAIVLENRVKRSGNDQLRHPRQRRSSRAAASASTQVASTLSMMLRTGSLPASISTTLRPARLARRSERSQHSPGRRRCRRRHVGCHGLHAHLLQAAQASTPISRCSSTSSSFSASWATQLGNVLTLPGIAGVILTIGMGVDSNVLIFERVREETRASVRQLDSSYPGRLRPCLGHHRRYPHNDHRLRRHPASSSAPARSRVSPSR